MPKRSIHRFTAALCVSAAAYAAAPSVSLAATPTSKPDNVPALKSMAGGATPAVITAPNSKKSSANSSQSYSTGVIAKSAAASTTAPTTAPTQAVASGPPLNPAPPATQPTDIAGDVELAERLCSVAQASIPQKVKSNDQWPALWEQSGALLSAAVKLNPSEGRFPRLLAEVMLQSNDETGAIDALGKARRANPSDQFAQTQVIDLYVNRMETAVEKIAYLKDILGRPAIAEPIRSHAGVVCASLMMDRGQTEAAHNVLSEALRLNPYNAAALKMRYETLPPAATNFERCEALMEILRANPAQPEIAAALADRLASAGIVDDSLPWFNLAASLYAKQGRSNLDLALNLACELFIAKQNGAASNLTNQLCLVSPGASGNWFLKVLIAHSRGDDAGYQTAMKQATNALTNSLVSLMPKSPGQASSTTKPIDSPEVSALPDLQPAVDAMLKSPPPPQREAFELALADLATLQVYFAQKPGDAAPVIAALKQLTPTSTVINRLEGYSALDGGNLDEAKHAFEACRGKDPLGELGLVRLQAKDSTQVQAASLAGRALLNAHPSGLLGAFLLDGLRDLRGEIIPSKEADALKVQVEQFPTDWLRVIDNPQNFYALRVDPIALARDYGEPLLARLTVLNLTTNPLPLGATGVLKPDLWFNANVRGVATQRFDAIAYDRLAAPLVLAPQEMFSQVIRLDQGALQQLLDANFSQTIEIIGDVISNPVAAGNGQVMSGPGGYHITFAHPFSRNAAPLNGPAAQRALTTLTSGTPEDKFAAIDLLGVYLRYIAANPAPGNANQSQTVGVFEDALHKATSDAVPAVAAWAALTAVRATPSASTEQQIVDLTQSGDWRHRQISLLAANALSADAQMRIATSLSADPEPSVRTAADARLKYLALPSTAMTKP